MSAFGFGAPAKTTGFNFGAFGTSTTTTAPTFGTATTGFGFGATPATSAPGTTGFGTMFGQPTGTAAPGTSAFSFGQPAATTTTTGFTFGQPTTTTATGFGFGQPAAPAAQTSFGFGQPTTTATGFSFGQPATTTTTGFSFGQPTAAATTSTGFGFGQPTGTSFGFGAQTSAPTFNFGGGLGTSTTAPTFSFGAPSSTTAGTGFGFGGFGASTTTTQSNPFGGSSIFSTGFGSSTAPSFGAAALGTAPGASSASSITNLVTAVSLPTVFNDERDTILAKWNQLQAFWGTGKGYYSPGGGEHVVFTPENQFCRFKAVGYSRMPEAKVEDGLVALLFQKKLEEVQPMQSQLVEVLGRVLGSKPNLAVCVEGLKSLASDRCELLVYVMERSPMGQVQRAPCNALASYLEQANVKAELAKHGVQATMSKAASREWLKHYLENPPCGIDKLLWDQAKLDNPDPERLIPVPMIGFTELRSRFKLQEHELSQHRGRLDAIAEDISKLKLRHTDTVGKIEERKRKQQNLYSRILKVMVHQEVSRKMGFAIQPEEEELRTMLESNLAELSAPTQFRGRLNEMMSQIKLQNNQMTCSDTTIHCSLDPSLQVQLKEHLANQQKGINKLIMVLKSDMEELKKLEASVLEANSQRR
uniref:Nucleoporin Nup54 alpha-helical domain-containing protein n=1 Tax=Amblyomma maculatum TaxID=34609 RepID=G3MKP0_AMBMU